MNGREVGISIVKKTAYVIQFIFLCICDHLTVCVNMYAYLFVSVF